MSIKISIYFKCRILRSECGEVILQLIIIANTEKICGVKFRSTGENERLLQADERKRKKTTTKKTIVVLDDDVGKESP